MMLLLILLTCKKWQVFALRLQAEFLRWMEALKSPVNNQKT
jgi:hypothetical protein